MFLLSLSPSDDVDDGNEMHRHPSGCTELVELLHSFGSTDSGNHDSGPSVKYPSTYLPTHPSKLSHLSIYLSTYVSSYVRSYVARMDVWMCGCMVICARKIQGSQTQGTKSGSASEGAAHNVGEAAALWQFQGLADAAEASGFRSFRGLLLLRDLGGLSLSTPKL